MWPLKNKKHDTPLAAPPAATDPRKHAVASWRRMFTEGRLNSWTDARRPTDFDFHLELLVRLLTVEKGRPISVLDVGSGPISMFSKNFVDIGTVVAAADTMAPEYDLLVDELGIDTERKLVRPVRAESETLSRDLAGQTFDLVVMRNALDHCQDPVAVLRPVTAHHSDRRLLAHRAIRERGDCREMGGFPPVEHLVQRPLPLATAAG